MAVAQITSITADTRWLTLVSGTLLTADLVGGGVMMTVLLGRANVSALASLGLLVVVTLSWMRASALVVLAERPIAGALGELRRVTGAPVDPSAPWPRVGVQQMAPSELGWDHLLPLIAAATLRHARARLALSWAVITTTGLCVWMILSFAVTVLS